MTEGLPEQHLQRPTPAWARTHLVMMWCGPAISVAWTLFCSVLGTVLLMAGFVISAAAAEGSVGGETPVSNEPWPVLPDGRLVLDIFARHVALAPCDTCRRDIRFLIVSPHADPVNEHFKFGDVIQSPGRLRRALVHASTVLIGTGNLPNMPGLLFGRFDRRAFPTSQVLTVAIYRDPLGASDCAPGRPLGAPRCDVLLRLASEAGRADPAGFVVNQGHFYGGSTTDTLYVAADQALRSAVGLPPFFVCNWASICANDLNAMEGPGFLVEPDLGMAFSFQREIYPETEWLDLQQKMKSVLKAIVIK